MKSSDRLRTAWMWPTDDGTFGLGFDAETKTFHWYDQIGCACGESFNDQPLAEFERKGVPGGVPTIPDDILAEIAVAVARLNQPT